MFPQRCSELEQLIIIIRDGDKSGTNHGLKDDKYLMRIMDHLLSDDREKIEKGIKWLEDDFNRNEEKYVDVRTSIAMMIAYAYCKLENQKQTSYYAWIAKEQFPRYPKSFWNEALAFWFLGIVYRNDDNVEGAKNVLRIAKELLEKHAEVARGEGYDETLDLCHEQIHKIEQTIKELPPHTVSPPPPASKSRIRTTLNMFRRSSSAGTVGPDEPPMKKDVFRRRPMRRGNESPTSNQQGQEISGSASPGSGLSPFHIIIPVDTDALMNPQKASRALDANLYEWLSEYNRLKSNRISTNEGAQAKSPQPTKKPGFIIPPLPIYGKATAGPKGEVTFEEPEWANGVPEDYQVEFSGIKHKVYSTREKDAQIRIVEGNIYGWLKVDGESMNRTTPETIDDQDYVLFYKINDPKSCENKIVIATQPGLDEQCPLLIIKRLKSDSTAWSKYYLQSESSLNVANIPFTKANQLIGEVVAVAKPAQ